MRHSILPGSLLTLSLLPAIACSGFSSPDAVSDHVAELSGVAYTREGGLTIGRGAVRLARVGMAAAGEESPRLLELVKDFRVGVYRAENGPDGRRPLRAEDFPRYEPVLTMQAESGEDILLVSRSSRRTIRELLLVIDGRQRLTVVQLRGELEQVLEEAIRLAFGRAERPELAGAALERISPPPPVAPHD